MPGFTNYTELQASVAEWAARGDQNFGTHVEDFIRLGEERIWKNLRCSDMVSAPGALVVPDGLNYVALPTDWLGFVRLKAANGRDDVNYQPMHVLDRLGPNGDEYVYSIEGRYFYYGQNGAAGTGTSLPYTYYQHPGLLKDATDGVTWLLTKYPTVYLMGALWAGSVFLKNAGKAAEYDAMLEAARDGIISQDRAAMISGGPLRRRGPGA